MRAAMLLAAAVTLFGPATPGEPFDEPSGGPVRIYLADAIPPEPPAVSVAVAPPEFWPPPQVSVRASCEGARHRESRGPPIAGRWRSV